MNTITNNILFVDGGISLSYGTTTIIVIALFVIHYTLIFTVHRRK